jgi:hypothetical protein
VRHLRRVIELQPRFRTAYEQLGEILLLSQDWLGAVELYRAAVQRFPAWEIGYYGLVYALGHTGANAEGVRVYYAAVLHADSTWTEQVRRVLRYNAACCAVLAGTGAGSDAPPSGERIVFRQQALEWLRAELAACEKGLQSGSAGEKAAAARSLAQALGDADLAPVREADALATLPTTEQNAWNGYWNEVRRLHADPAAGSGKSR